MTGWGLISNGVRFKIPHMVEAAQQTVDLDELLAEAARAIARFRHAPGETPEGHSDVKMLVRLFDSLERRREKYPIQPDTTDVRLSISRAMLSLNETLRKLPGTEPSDQFKNLYHFHKTVEPQPELLDLLVTPEEFKQAIVEARQLGLNLCQDAAFQADLEEVPHKKKHFYSRLAKICRSHECYACVNADALPAILADASTFEALAEQSRQKIDSEANKAQSEAQKDFMQIKSALASTPIRLEECLNGATHLSELFASKTLRSIIKNDVVEAFHLLKEKRSSSDLTCEASLSLSRAMLVLNEALRLRTKKESGSVGRFDDLYEFYESVKFNEELDRDPKIRHDLQMGIREAYKIGLEILADNKEKRRLDLNPRKKSHLLSRLGEFCHLQAVYECDISSDELPNVLEYGIELFRTALCVLPESKGKNLDFNYSRIADCQIRLGRHAEAIETLMAVSNPGNGIKQKTAWEARCHLAECHQVLGQEARLDEDLQGAQEYFQNAENWYIEAAHIWEPELDPRSATCQNEQNRTLHGQMAWLYLDWGDPVQAEKQARMFLSGEKVSGQNAKHTSYILLIWSNLGTALLRQNGRTVEAIQVFEQVLAHDLAPAHRIRPLIALRQLYVLEGRTEDIQKTNRVLVDTYNQVEDNRYACLLALTDEQSFALLDFTGMSEYVRSCKKRLARGDVLPILNELPRMVSAARLLSPYDQDDSVLLSLLAQADFQVGNFKAALDTFKYVLTLNRKPKNQGITWMLIGNVHLAEQRLDDALAAYTTSHKLGGEMIAPLLKAANVCLLKGDYVEAFQFLDAIEQTGRDDRPNVTKTVRARTLWNKFQKVGNQEDGRAACRELVEVIQNAEHRDSVAVRCLTEMLSYPAAQDFLAEILETTANETLVNEIRYWLAKHPDIPQPVLNAVIRRLANRATTLDSGKVLVGILTLAMVQGYFAGTVAGMTFEEFASEVCQLFLSLEPQKRRAWLLELFTAERNAPSTMFLHRYADVAMKLLAPILANTEDAQDKICSAELLESLNSFLKQTIPAGICPSAYASGDSTDLRPRLEALVDARIDELSEYINSGCRIQVASLPAKPVWVCWYQWMKAQGFIVELVGVVGGPLQELASETAVWSVDVSVQSNVLEITFGFDPIDASRNPPQVLEGAERALREWQQRAKTALNISFSDVATWIPTRRITTFVAVPPPRLWPRSLKALEQFVNYLVDESDRIMSSGGIDTTFFQQADTHFLPAQASVFEASGSDWVLFFRYMLDQQFALTADWFMTSPRHPRGVIHDLKRDVQSLIAKRATGQLISLQDIQNFQRKTLYVVAAMNKFLKSEIFGDGFTTIDAGATVTRFIAPMRERFSKIEVRENLTPAVYVEINPQMFESVILNLMHNAITAASSSGIPPWVSIVVTKLETDQQTPQMLLKMTNPYDPTTTGTPSGTGIGLEVSRHIVEKLNNGHVFEIPNKDSKIYEVGVLLPLAGDN